MKSNKLIILLVTLCIGLSGCQTAIESAEMAQANQSNKTFTFPLNTDNDFVFRWEDPEYHVTCWIAKFQHGTSIASGSISCLTTN